MAPSQKRLKVQTLLENILGSDQVYFQPPSNVQMKYPCIVYERFSTRTSYADNEPYKYDKRYQVTVIDRDPDSPLPDMIAALPKSSFSRFFTADNLNHDVFNVFF